MISNLNSMPCRIERMRVIFDGIRCCKNLENPCTRPIFPAGAKNAVWERDYPVRMNDGGGYAPCLKFRGGKCPPPSPVPPPMSSMQRGYLHPTALVLLGLLSVGPASSEDAYPRVELSGCAAADTGSSSGDMMIGIDYDAMDMPNPTQTMPSCTLPDDVVFPSVVAGTEQQLTERALCHATCVDDQVVRS